MLVSRLTREGEVGIIHESIGCLAQLVEHRPYKARVGGSNPSAPTTIEMILLMRILSFWSGSSVG